MSGTPVKAESDIVLDSGEISQFIIPENDSAAENMVKMHPEIPAEVVSMLICLQALEKRNSLGELAPEDGEPCFVFGGMSMGLFSTMETIASHLFKTKGSNQTITFSEIWCASPGDTETAVALATPVSEIPTNPKEAASYRNIKNTIAFSRPFVTYLNDQREMIEKSQSKKDIDDAISLTSTVLETFEKFVIVHERIKVKPWPLLKGEVASLIEDIKKLDVQGCKDRLANRRKSNSVVKKKKAPTDADAQQQQQQPTQEVEPSPEQQPSPPSQPTAPVTLATDLPPPAATAVAVITPSSEPPTAKKKGKETKKTGEALPEAGQQEPAKKPAASSKKRPAPQAETQGADKSQESSSPAPKKKRAETTQQPPQ